MPIYKLLFLLTTLFFYYSNSAQSLFSKVYSNYNNEYLSSSIIGLDDGSVVICGTHNSKNMIMRIDDNGEILWNKDIGYGYYQSGAMCKSLDNNFILAASVAIETNNYNNLFCVKMNIDGDTMWTRTYNFGENVNVNWIDKTNDSGYIIAGNIQNDVQPYTYIIVVKIDENGNYQWSKILSGGILGNSALAVDQCDIDSAYYITGHFSDIDPYQSRAFLLKLYQSGEIHYTRTYSRPEHNYTNGKGIIVDNENIVLLASVGPASLIKTDLGGNIIWANSGYNDGYEFCGFDLRKWRIVKNTNNGYKFLSGDFIYETDSVGDIEYSMFFEMCTSDFVSVNGITTVSGNGPMIGVKENTNPQIGLINYDSLYQTSGMCVYENTDFNFDVEISTETSVIIQIDHEVEEIFHQPEITSSTPIIEDKCVAFLGSVDEYQKNNFAIHPNPTNGIINIEALKGINWNKIKLTDIRGATIYTKDDTDVFKKVDLRDYPSGVYLLTIISNNIENHRIILQK